MAAGKPIVEIEGEAELTRRLAALESKMQRKVLVKAAKAAGNVVKKDYQENVAVRTGAMRDAVFTYQRTYKHKAATGKMATRAGKSFVIKRVVAQDIGATVQITRKRLLQKANQKKRGLKSLPLDKRSGGMFFYPAMVELGGHGRAGARPLTKALYHNDGEIRDIFIGNLRTLIAAAGVT